MPLDHNNPQLKKGGRKGYEYEQEQLDRMRRLLDKDLKIAERLQDSDELNATDKEKLAVLQARVLKYADKLHVSKTSTDITTKGESVNMSPEALALAKRYEEELNKIEDGA